MMPIDPVNTSKSGHVRSDMKAKALRQLCDEVDRGFVSGEREGWLPLATVERQLGIPHE